MLKVKVAPGACQGHARCWALAPEFFELDDQGFIAFDEKPLGDADEKLIARATRACPERALSLVDDEGDAS